MTTATDPNNAPQGIILFAHGSRDPLWRKPIEAVAAQIDRHQPGLDVRCAFLELCEPSLPDAVNEMVQRQKLSLSNATNSIAPCARFITGIGQFGLKIRIIPMFLGMGKHAREDLPELAAQLRLTHPDVEFDIAPTVGEDPRVIALLAELACS